MTEKTFSEALIAERYRLNGWLVETGIPLVTDKTVKTGSRGEADIVALKNIDGRICVEHVEVGSLARGPQLNLDMVKDKFSDRAKDTLIRWAKRRLGEIEVDYSCRYIATSGSKPSLNLIKESGFRIERLPDVIQMEILPGIVEWKKKKLTGTKSLPTIPKNLWFISFLDYIAYHRVDLQGYREMHKYKKKVS
jgi:hypothetical protein